MTDQPSWIDRPATDALAGLTLNRPGAELWALAIGKFILNFALLEAMTYWWIGELSSDNELLTLAQDLPFSRRVALISRLLKRASLPDESKNRVLRAWQDASRLSELRNDIAHNPVVSWRSGDNEPRLPGADGIFSFRRLDVSNSAPAKYLTRADIEAAIPQSNSIIEALHDQLATIRTARSKSGDGAPAA